MKNVTMISRRSFLKAAMAASAVSALALTGCGGSKTADSSSDAQDSSTSTSDTADYKLATEGTLTMATNAYFEPWEYYDGDKIVGIDPEVAQAIADKLGLKLEIMDMDFDSIITAVSAGKADMGMAGMTVTEDRQTQVDFSDTYATGVQSVIVTEDSDIASLDDLKGKQIGVQQGTTGDLYSTDDFGEESVQRFSKGADAVQALSTGKIDAVIIDNKPAQVFVDENEGLKLLETPYAEEEYAIAVKKGNTELLDAINASIANLKESGKLDEIVAKYITAE